MKTGTKFKVGDKVRLSPSATIIGVPQEEIGKTGVIKAYYDSRDIQVYMDKPWRMWEIREIWCIREDMIEPVIRIGEQLEFPFMLEEGR